MFVGIPTTHVRTSRSRKDAHFAVSLNQALNARAQLRPPRFRALQARLSRCLAAARGHLAGAARRRDVAIQREPAQRILITRAPLRERT